MRESIQRVIGEFSAGNNGPLLLFLGAIHGNEPAGVFALNRVFEKLHQLKKPFQGRLIGICGNCKAFHQNKRYIDRDLNRLWSADEIQRVQSLHSEDRNAEEAELLEILEQIDAARQTQYAPKIFVDLHTTSGDGGLFSIVTDEAKNRELAEVLYAPIIFNLVDELALTTNKYFEREGLMGIAFEGGQHDAPESVDNHEAAIWLLMEKAGCIKAEDYPFLEDFRKQLKMASRDLATYMNVSYRHPISPTHQFKMKPGYSNFQFVEKGELVARDFRGDIYCPMDGQLLMPLYQPQGEDGFFVVRELERPPV